MYRITPCLLSLLLLLVSCKKEKEKDPLSQLPPETQTGANTFGCLINGEIFKPGGAQLSGGSLQCNYQFVDKAYYFVLIGRYRMKRVGNSVGLYADSLQIQKGQKYILKSRTMGNSSGTILLDKDLTYDRFVTDGSSYTGELWIKHFDTVGQIASGTFWFDAVSETGEVVQVREGRFDMGYRR